MKFFVFVFILFSILNGINCQFRGVGKLKEVFSWKQISYDINGVILDRDRLSEDGLGFQGRNRRQYDRGYSNNEDNQRNHRFPSGDPQHRPRYGSLHFSNMIDTPISRPNDDSNSFFIQYNNVPMGADRVGDRLFVTVPRRRYGIPSTLNYIDLSQNVGRSPSLKPYPTLREARTLTSVYRTRADNCGRLWMVDTGLLEIPNNFQQIRTPAIVVFDLRNDRQILRYEFKNTDIPANNTPAGLASITIDTSNGCTNTYAYIPDLITYGIIVYSMKDHDSWRVTHNYMHFNPLATNLRIAGQSFQWNDGIFSIILEGNGPCKTAYFHPLISTQEFSISTCVLNNKTAANDDDYWMRYSVVGERGPNTQSTMHDIHSSGVILYATVGRDGISCWNCDLHLEPSTVALLAEDGRRLSYPADLHITGDEVWVLANSLPRFTYSNLTTDEYNFFIYKANIQDLIAGTVCDRRPTNNNFSNNYNNYNNRYN